MAILQQQNPESKALLAATFQRRNEPQFALANAISTMQTLPGLRGLWSMASFDENGDAFDYSGQARTLTYNGNPTYNYSGLIPYIDLDGTGDYLSRADEAGLDIIGNEAYVANPGLTLGGWFYFDTVASTQGLITKYTTTGNQRAYFLNYSAVLGTFNFRVSNIGTVDVTVESTIVEAIDKWYFVVGRYIPSTTVDIYVSDSSATLHPLTKTTNSTAIPATMFNSNSPLLIGSFNAGAGLLNGRASLCFLCASALSDTIIQSLYYQTKNLYGV